MSNSCHNLPGDLASLPALSKVIYYNTTNQCCCLKKRR